MAGRRMWLDPQLAAREPVETGARVNLYQNLTLVQITSSGHISQVIMYSNTLTLL